MWKVGFRERLNALSDLFVYLNFCFVRCVSWNLRLWPLDVYLVTCPSVNQRSCLASNVKVVWAHKCYASRSKLHWHYCGGSVEINWFILRGEAKMFTPTLIGCQCECWNCSASAHIWSWLWYRLWDKIGFNTHRSVQSPQWGCKSLVWSWKPNLELFGGSRWSAITLKPLSGPVKLSHHDTMFCREM